jgi:hypothetical protein
MEDFNSNVLLIITGGSCSHNKKVFEILDDLTKKLKEIEYSIVLIHNFAMWSPGPLSSILKVSPRFLPCFIGIEKEDWNEIIKGNCTKEMFKVISGSIDDDFKISMPIGGLKFNYYDPDMIVKQLTNNVKLSFEKFLQENENFELTLDGFFDFHDKLTVFCEENGVKFSMAIYPLYCLINVLLFYKSLNLDVKHRDKLKEIFGYHNMNYFGASVDFDFDLFSLVKILLREGEVPNAREVVKEFKTLLLKSFNQSSNADEDVIGNFLNKTCDRFLNSRNL